LPGAAKRDASVSRSSRPRGYPREARLLRTADYDAVYRGGRRRSSRQFVMFYRRRPAATQPGVAGAADAVPSRFGMSVKRALGTAVERNRIRRRIREILRLHRQEIPSGWDIVIHPRRSVATAEFAPLAAELTGLLREALK